MEISSPPRPQKQQNTKVMIMIVFALLLHAAIFAIYHFYFKDIGADNKNPFDDYKHETRYDGDFSGHVQIQPYNEAVKEGDSTEQVAASMEKVTKVITPSGQSTSLNNNNDESNTANTNDTVVVNQNNDAVSVTQDQEPSKIVDDDTSPQLSSKADENTTNESGNPNKSAVQQNTASSSNTDSPMDMDSAIAQDKEIKGVDEIQERQYAMNYPSSGEGFTVSNSRVASTSIGKPHDINLLDIDIPKSQRNQNVYIGSAQSDLHKRVNEVKTDTEKLHGELSDTINIVKSINQKKIRENETQKKQAYQQKLFIEQSKKIQQPKTPIKKDTAVKVIDNDKLEQSDSRQTIQKVDNTDVAKKAPVLKIDNKAVSQKSTQPKAIVSIPNEPQKKESAPQFVNSDTEIQKSESE